MPPNSGRYESARHDEHTEDGSTFNNLLKNILGVGIMVVIFIIILLGIYCRRKRKMMEKEDFDIRIEKCTGAKVEKEQRLFRN